MLRKIEGYFVPGKLEPLRDFLLREGIEGMSVIEARGIGSRSPRGSDGRPRMEERIKVEIVVPEARVEAILRGIRSLVGEGEMGAGMLFVLVVEDALRLGTREAGQSAVL